MRSIRWFLMMVSLVVVAGLLLAGCARDQAGQPVDQGVPEPVKLKVVTTTSLIGHIVQEVGRDRVEVANIIPPASCPGHFDVKPTDMAILVDAAVFFMHAWQGEMFTDELIRAARNEELEKVVLAVQGNWMTPPVQSEAVTTITAALAAADPANASFYEENAAVLKQQVETVGREMKARLDAAGVNEVKVLVSEMQTGFLKWAGFDVAGHFGRPEDTSPKQMEELIKLGRDSGVTLVVDNLQSGHDAGKAIARELGAKHVMLSNFPGGFAGTDTWAQAIERNVDLLLDTLKG